MSLLIIIIYIFSLFVLVSLARGLSVLLIFFQRATCLSHWFFSIFCLHFYLFLLLHLLTLEFYSFLMYVFWGFPCSSAGKESTCNIGEPSLIPGLGWSPGEGNDCPLQYPGEFCGQRSLSYIPWLQSWIQLSDFHFHFQCMLVLSIAMC